MDENTFWHNIKKRVVVPSLGECWEWQTGLIKKRGSVKPFRYGRLWFEGRYRTAHRLAYELTHGDLPSGLQALHKCDNPKCINPDHIYAGTRSQNLTDRWTRNEPLRARIKERQEKAALLEQERVAAVMTAKRDLLNEVLALRASGLTLTEVGKRVERTPSAVSRIANRNRLLLGEPS